MLNMKYTRIFNTETRAVMPTAVIAEEGIALVEDIDGGETKVRPSTGAAGEVFAGVSMSRNVPPAHVANYEEGVVPASLSVKLARAPLAGQLLVKVGGRAVTVVDGAPANATEVRLSGQILTFASGEANKSIAVQYMYEPTVSEARAIVGDAPIGGLASAAQQVIGTLTKGEFATNFFDASVDWSDALNVSLGANGMFTVGGEGTLLSNVVIRNRPSSANAMLVLAIN